MFSVVISGPLDQDCSGNMRRTTHVNTRFYSELRGVHTQYACAQTTGSHDRK